MVFTGLVMAAPQSQAVRVGDLSKSGRWFRSEFPGVAEVVPAPLLLGLPFALEVALALLARRVKPRCPPLVALRALRGRQRLAGLLPYSAGDRPAAALCGPPGGL